MEAEYPEAVPEVEAAEAGNAYAIYITEPVVKEVSAYAVVGGRSHSAYDIGRRFGSAFMWEKHT